jgi:hypothetical protein
MSMNHLDEGTLLTLADGELAPADSAAVERHLAECGACRAELDELRGAATTFAATLARADSPAPVVSDTTARALRRRAERAGGGAERPPARGWRELGRAAVLVLGIATAAAAAVPGTPLNGWLRELVEPEPRVAAVHEVRGAPEAAPAVAAAEFEAQAGVSVLPERGTVRVLVNGASTALRIRAVLTDGPRAGVFAAGEAANARFSTGPGRIEVSGATAGELRIELPHNAIAATVEVNGRRYVAKQDDQLRLTVPAGDSAGAEVSFRVLQ